MMMPGERWQFQGNLQMLFCMVIRYNNFIYQNSVHIALYFRDNHCYIIINYF